jgi:hypothetical protein
MTHAIDKPLFTERPASAGRVRGGSLDQWICLWSYPAAMAVLAVALFYFAPYLPPMSPNASAGRIAEIYRSNATVMGWAMVVLLLVVGVQLPFQGLVVSYMRRMSGGGPLLGYVYVVTYAASMLPAAIFFALSFAVAAFRPDRDPQLIMMMNDLGYLGFIAVIGGFLFQYASLALAILCDKGQVLPLWLGYASVWAAVSELLFVPAFTFKTGPFAWSGILVFWMGIIIFGVWIGAMVIGMFPAIRRSGSLTTSSELLRHRVALKYPSSKYSRQKRPC